MFKSRCSHSYGPDYNLSNNAAIQFSLSMSGPAFQVTQGVYRTTRFSF